MRRALTTFLLLLILLLAAFCLTRNYRHYPTLNTDDYPRFMIPLSQTQSMINQDIQMRYQNYIDNIEQYRLGVPRFEYNNPNAPYSNPSRYHPQAFINGYRQPIDGIVPDMYCPTLDRENMMFPEINQSSCNANKSSCMDMTQGYYSDLLNNN